MNTLLELTFTVAMPSLAAALLLGAIVLHFGIKSMHADRATPTVELQLEQPATEAQRPATDAILAAFEPQPTPLVAGRGFHIGVDGRVYAGG